MLRNRMADLVDWKNKEAHLPILLLGARQVGKTYLLKEFANEQYEDSVYINFENDPNLHTLFDKDLNPKRIIDDIALYIGGRIKPKKTLIIFDEIQLEERAITALKYFAEETPEFDVVCAGSLLGVAVGRTGLSFPVGKAQFMHLYPFTFDEFIRGVGQELLVDRIKVCYQSMEAMPELLHTKLLDLYKKYLCVGGMPAAVVDYVRAKGVLSEFDQQIHGNIINAYIADMGKYTTPSEHMKVQGIYRSIPTQLSGDHRKFKYSVINKNAKASRYGSSIEWLLMSQINLECEMVNRPEFPLSAYVSKGFFKLYMSDVGLLMNLARIPYSTVVNEGVHNLFKEAITENYVAQQLSARNEQLYYWKNNTHELDFIKVIGDDIIPIEVKAGHNKRSRSLNEYIRRYNPAYSIRLSTKNFGVSEKIQSIPLYAAFLLC